MNPAGIIDVAAIVLIAGLTIYGVWRGLIKTVAGLIITVLTIAGAIMVASAFSGPLADWAAPKVEAWIAGQIQEAVKSEDIPAKAAEDAGLDSGEVDFSSVDFSAVPIDQFSSLLERLGGALPAGIAEGLENLRNSFSGTLSQAISKVVAGLLRPACYAILYILSYFALSLLGGIVLKLLDPVLKLPFLHALDHFGGGVLGLAEGCLIVYITLAIVSRFPLEGLSESVLIGQILPRLPQLPFLR